MLQAACLHLVRAVGVGVMLQAACLHLVRAIGVGVMLQAACLPPATVGGGGG